MKKINFDLLTDKEIVEKLSSDDYEGGNILLAPNASLEEKTKYQLGKAILSYQLDNNLTLKKVANKLKISEEKLYNICRGAVKDFSLLELLNYLENLSPNWELQINNKEIAKHGEIYHH